MHQSSIVTATQNFSKHVSCTLQSTIAIAALGYSKTHSCTFQVTKVIATQRGSKLVKLYVSARGRNPQLYKIVQKLCHVPPRVPTVTPGYS